MRAVLSGGGTAGHINPALALAEELTARGWEVLYAGRPDSVEERLAKQADLPFTPFTASGFNRRHPTTLVKGIASILKSSKAARAWFDTVKPDVVVAFGGYVCLPVGRAAKSAGIPFVVHEQNSLMGLSNKYLAKRASCVCLTYEQAGEGLPASANVVVTGNPVRRSVVAATREEGRAMLGVPDDAIVLLVTGGSAGARHVNQALCAVKDELLACDEKLVVVHIAGPKEYESTKELLALTPDQEKRWLLFGYQDHMGECMAAADAIVSRAGATSLAEISARAIPALLVPYPYATGDHQTTNARAYVDAGCAYMLADADVEKPEFLEKIVSLVTDASVRASMSEAARLQKTLDASRLLADEVEKAAGC